MREKLDAVLKQAVAHGDVPGVVAMVLDRESIQYAGAFGVRDLESGAPMNLDTTFRLASMTKAITSVAAMQLVEQGRLALDAPVASVLPAFGDLGVLTGFYGEHPALRAPRTTHRGDAPSTSHAHLRTRL
jgi:methyl acetate hydrolase